jgi:hypothetical protein
MNFILNMILCSAVSGTCLPPHELKETYYKDQYSCLLKGYEKSIEKMEEIGRVIVNENQIFIKFYCQGDKKTDA